MYTITTKHSSPASTLPSESNRWCHIVPSSLDAAAAALDCGQTRVTNERMMLSWTGPPPPAQQRGGKSTIPHRLSSPSSSSSARKRNYRALMSDSRGQVLRSTSTRESCQIQFRGESLQISFFLLHYSDGVLCVERFLFGARSSVKELAFIASTFAGAAACSWY